MSLCIKCFVMVFGITAEYDYSALQKGLLENADGFDNLNKKAGQFHSASQNRAKDTARELDRTRAATDALTKSFTGLIKTIGVGLGVREVLNFGGAALKASGNYEQLNKTFETFLKSGELSKKMLLDLQKLGVQTPLGQKELEGSAKSMLAFNFQAKEVIPTIKRLGDVSTGTGKNLQELSVIYGQVRLAGRLMGQDLLQFTNAGVPLIAELAKNFGVAESQIKKMVEEGKVGFKDVEKAFITMTSEGGLFFNLMANQSDSFLGKVERVSDQFDQFKRRLGDELMPVAKEALGAVGDFFDSFDFEKLKEFGSLLRTVIGLLKDYGPFLLKSAAAYYVLLKGVQAYQAGVKLYRLGIEAAINSNQRLISNNWALVSAQGLVIRGLAILKTAMASAIPLALGLAITALIDNWQRVIDVLTGVTKAQRAAKNASEDVVKQFREEKKATDELFGILRDATKTIKQRTEALDELKRLYPEYVGNLNVEKSTLVDIADAQDRVNKAIYESVIAKKKAQIQEEAYNKYLDNNLRILQLQNGDDVGIVEAVKVAGNPLATRQTMINALKKQNDELLTNQKEATYLLGEASKQMEEELLKSVPGVRQTGSQSRFLKDGDERERAFTASLKRMTDAELARLTASEKIEVRDRQLVLEEIERRKELTKATQDNTESLKKYQDELAKLQQRLKTSQRQNILGKIDDPIERLKAEERFALEEIANERKLTLEKYKSKAQRAEITRLFAALEWEVVQSYSQKILEAEGKLSEQELAIRKEKLAEELKDTKDYYNNRIGELRVANLDPDLNLEGRRRNEESILQEEAAFAEKQMDLIRENNGEQSEEYRKAYEDFKIKNAAYHKALLDNQKAYIAEQDQATIADIDRQLEHGKLSNSKRRLLELEKIELLLKSAKAQLDIQRKLAKGDDDEINRLTNLIADLEAQSNKISSTPAFKNFGDVLKEWVTIDDDDVEGLNQLKDAVGSLVSSIYRGEIEEINRSVEARQKYIDQLKKDIEVEKDLKDKGFASEYDSLKQKLANEEALIRSEKKKSIQLQKESLRQEALIQSAQQAGAIATAVANLIQHGTKYGIAGLFAGAAAVIQLFAIWKNYRTQAKALSASEESLYTGGLIKDHMKPGETPKSDRPGLGKGHKIEGTNLRVGADEFLMNAVSTSKNLRFLHEMNAGKYDNVDLASELKPRYRGIDYAGYQKHFDQVVIIKEQKQEKIFREAMESGVQKAIVDGFMAQNQLLKDLDSKRPTVIVHPNGDVEYMYIKGNTVESRIRKSS